MKAKSNFALVLVLLAVVALLGWHFAPPSPRQVQASFDLGVQRFRETRLAEAEQAFNQCYNYLPPESEEYVVANQCLGYIRNEHFLDTEGSLHYYNEASHQLHAVKSPRLKIKVYEGKAHALNLLKRAGSFKCALEAIREMELQPGVLNKIEKLVVLEIFETALQVDPASPKGSERVRVESRLRAYTEALAQNREPEPFFPKR